MTKDELLTLAATLMEESGLNTLSAEEALTPAFVGVPLYDAPILAIGAADDPLFDGLKQPEAIGPHFRTPQEWLPGAKSVVSLFFPLSQAVREDNRARMDWPGFGWINAKSNGMDMIDAVNERLRAELEALGYQAMSPIRAPQYAIVADAARREYTSNWSERHAAYICGLGTFGLSRGLITKKGVAGRFTSLITDLLLPPDARDYSGLYDYCSFCGACAKNCPAGAIDLKAGKDHVLCAAFTDRVLRESPPRSGARNPRDCCGKCQVKVPCEGRPAPPKKKGAPQSKA